MLTVQATCYENSAKVSAVRLPTREGFDKEWLVRCIHGPAWFLNLDTGRWDISSAGDFDVKFTAYRMTEEEAVRRLREGDYPERP